MAAENESTVNKVYGILCFLEELDIKRIQMLWTS